MGIQELTYKIAQESGVATDDNKKFMRTARLTYQATSDNPANETTYTMERAYGAPAAGKSHPFIPFLWASKVNCRKVNQVMYEFDVDFAGRGQPGQSPLDEPPSIEFDFVVSEEAYDQDYEGNPILFCTGEAPDPGLKETEYDLLIRISRNLAEINVDLMSRYAGVTNSDDFLGLSAGTCKIVEPPKAKSAEWEGQIYWKATVGVQVRRGIAGLYDDSEAWYRRVLAAGLYIRTFKPGPGGKTWIQHARDADGNKVTKPVLHSIQGGSGNNGFMIPRDPDTGLQDPRQAEWYKFKPRKAPLPFSALQVV